MKRILIVSQHFPPEKSGNASRIYDMSINLIKLGLDVTVVSPPPSFPHGTFKRTWKLINYRNIEGIENVNLWTWQPNSRDPGFLSRISYYIIFPINALAWSSIHFKDFEIIITSSPPLFTGIPGYGFSKLFLKSWILDVRDRWIDASISLGFLKKGSFYEKISRIFESLCYRNADLIAVTTRELGNKISIKGYIQKKIILAPNGVDTDLFYPFEVQKKNQIIYAGNIGYAQDLDKVILAMAEINKTYDLKMLLVGDGDTRQQLEQLAKDEGLEDRIIFAGMTPRENIPKMISESLVGLAPLKKMETLEYAVPTKAYEYLACGIPFIGCGKGEISKLAAKSGGGIIADNSSGAIANAIIELISNPQKCRDMGRNGRDYVKNFYDRKSIAFRLKQAIEQMP